MNPSALKKVGQVVVGFGLLFATALAFQNCSGYQMYDSATQTDLSSTCGASCDQTVQGLNLKLTNSRISLQDANLPPTNRVVDIGGYCDDAEYPESEIQYQFLDGVTPVTNWQSKNVKCSDIGRFQLPADVPTITASRSYTLLVRPVIPLSGGQYLINPAAQKSLIIDITK